MSSKKGFISFILFFILSLGVLTISTQPPQHESTAPAQIFKSIKETHIHLKRAFKPTAISAVKDAQTQLSTTEPTTITLGASSIILDKLTTELEDNLIRIFILYNFNTILTDYSNYSNFNSFYYCKPPASSTPSLHQKLLPLTPSNTIYLWGGCATKIQITHLINKTKIQILDGFYVHTNHKTLPISMDSKLEPFEVS